MTLSELPTPRPCSQGEQLVADIGGTHVRFGLTVDGNLERVETLLCADFDSVSDAARDYLQRAAPLRPPCEAAFAAAGPVRHGRIRMTNHVWSIVIHEVRRELGLERFEGRASSPS